MGERRREDVEAAVAEAERSCFCPCEGGFEELPGFFGGRVSSLSRASRAAMRVS